MLLPHLLRALLPIFITGGVVCSLSIVLCTTGFLEGHRWFRLAFWLIPFAYPLICWILYAGAARHDAHIEETLRATGAVARATIVAVRDTGAEYNNSPILELELQVTPSDAASFSASAFVMPARISMHQAQPGAWLSVRYDPEDHARIMVDQ